MVDPRRHAAALVAVLALSAPGSALAQEPLLLAQIEDATPAPAPQSQPPLSEEPPEALGGDGGNGATEEEPADPAEDAPEPLPDTGLEAGLVALLGLGLIASGSGLRVTLRRGD